MELSVEQDYLIFFSYRLCIFSKIFRLLYAAKFSNRGCKSVSGSKVVSCVRFRVDTWQNAYRKEILQPSKKNYGIIQLLIAAIPGNSFPSKYSSIAPPPVLT